MRTDYRGNTLDEYIGNRFRKAKGGDAKFSVGVLGGSFDPIHVGHELCAQAVQDQLGLDAVLLVPDNVSAYEEKNSVTPAADRLAMCRMVAQGHEGWFASDVDIARGGITYTIDTMKDLRRAYPQVSTWVFIMGSDSLENLKGWRKAKKLAKLMDVAVVCRKGYGPMKKALKSVGKLGFRVRAVEADVPQVSSTEMRQALCYGFPKEGLLNDDVIRFCTARGLYAPGYERYEDKPQRQTAVSGALGDDFFTDRLLEVQGRVNEHRFAHIRGVAAMAARLAREYGVDERKARLAGLLHDWDKGYDDQGIRARADELGLEFDPLVYDFMPQTMHGITAACALSREFPEIPADVIQAIDRHTTAACDMTPLDMVVYCADGLEEGRDFGIIDELRRAIGQVDLEELFFKVYGYWTVMIVQKQRTMHPDTIRVWNHYAIRFRDRHFGDYIEGFAKGAV